MLKNFNPSKTMITYIIIIATAVVTQEDNRRLSDVLSSFDNYIDMWSIDLTDCDKVMRIVSRHDISTNLLQALKIENLDCYLMGFFEKAA